MHIVGHSLGGKVAAVAALQLAKQLEDSRAAGSKDVRILSMTMIDVSPVDYSCEEAFQDVFRTVDIVRDLDAQLPLVGSNSSKPPGYDSSVNIRAALNTLLSERVSDPMLKAFLLTSIQPKEREKEKEMESDPRVGGLSSTINALANKIKMHRSHHSLQQRQMDATATASVRRGCSDSPASSTIPRGFEWKFSVRGIVDFRSRLGGWPEEFSKRGEDSGDTDDNPGTMDAVSNPFLNPVLLMKGANSKFVRSSHIPCISSLFPSFTLMTVRDAGHWLHFEKPRESADLLMKFILTVEDRMAVE